MTLSNRDALAIGEKDAHDQAAMLASGDVSRRELVASALLRIELVDGEINAVTHVASDAALARADAGGGDDALAGLPYLLKASLEYPGWPMTSCSRSRAGAVGRVAFPFVQSLDAAGLIPIGMTSMPEFGLLTGGEPLLTGPVRNPWSPAHSAGGSSTGAAAAVAAGIVPLAHASDAAGSIRIPAACCGVVGMKASRATNRRARAPHVIDDLLCCDGLIGRSVRDVAWGQRITLDPAAMPEPARSIGGLRIALCLDGLDGRAPDREVRAAVIDAARASEALGCHIEEAALPVDGAAVIDAFRTIWLHEGGEIADLIGAGAAGTPLDRLLEPWTNGLAERRAGLVLGDTGRAFAQVTASARALAAFFADFDLVLSPVTSTPPPPIGRFDPAGAFEALWDFFWRYTNYTPLQNIAGTPAISLPLGMAADGRPIGVMAAAGAGRDPTLLAFAEAIEQAMPWRDRWPPLSAPALAERQG